MSLLKKSSVISLSLLTCIFLNAQQGPTDINSALIIQKASDHFRQDKPKEAINEYLKISRNDTNYSTVLHDLSYKKMYYPINQFEDFKKVINASADFNKVVLVLEKM